MVPKYRGEFVLGAGVLCLSPIQICHVKRRISSRSFSPQFFLLGYSDIFETFRSWTYLQRLVIYKFRLFKALVRLLREDSRPQRAVLDIS
jgi:hypothetical protein